MVQGPSDPALPSAVTFGIISAALVTKAVDFDKMMANY